MMSRNTEACLLTDLYQLTMAYGYWQQKRADDEAVFHLYFRRLPFQGGYAIAAGLAPAVEVMRDFRFEEEDVAYLATLCGHDGTALFPPAFLSDLRDLRFSCDVDALPEGTAVFPNQPLLRIRGPLIQCQLLETVLLNVLNFQTLVATKASRVCAAAGNDDVLEFGLRRAQGMDGGLAASRAAYVGGVAATSNVLAGKQFGIPVKGTHAHSWVMSFDTEVEAFEAYADAMPNNCVFLVDTYDTARGVQRAIEVGKRLQARGQRLLGIRLDSGDLAALSQTARRMLDDAGFPDAAVVASNDLDEFAIARLKADGAQIGIWGVGTKLVTAYDQPALGGVYKLASLKRPGGAWRPAIKLSNETVKTSLPGHLQVQRRVQAGRFVGDVIYDETTATPASDGDTQTLLEPVFRAGAYVGTDETLETLRARSQQQRQALGPDVCALENPTAYPVTLEPALSTLRDTLIANGGSAPQQEPPCAG